MELEQLAEKHLPKEFKTLMYFHKCKLVYNDFAMNESDYIYAARAAIHGRLPKRLELVDYKFTALGTEYFMSSQGSAGGRSLL